MSVSADKPYGNGLLLWFEIDDFDAAMSRAAEMKAQVVQDKQVTQMACVEQGSSHHACDTGVSA
jgi:hypothetical protein